MATSSLVKTALYGEGEILDLKVDRNRMELIRFGGVACRCQLGTNSLRGVSSESESPSTSLFNPNNLSCSGYTDVPEGTISPTSVSVSFIPPSKSSNPTPLRLLTNGEPEPSIDESRASELLAEEDLDILVDLGVEGGEAAKYWTCDFSHVSSIVFRHQAACLIQPRVMS